MFNRVVRCSRILTLLLALSLAPCAGFAAYSEASPYDALFEANRASALVDQLIQTQISSINQSWRQETDPVRKARLQAMYAEAERILRNKMSWPRVLPLARAAYGSQFSSDEVAPLQTYFSSAAGQIYLRKVLPTRSVANAEAQLYFSRRMESIRQQLLSGRNANPVETAPADAKEALARAYLDTDGGLQADFTGQMLTLEETLLGNIAPQLSRMSEAKQEAARTEIKRLVAAFRAQIGYAEIAQIHAKALAQALSEDDLQQLMSALRDPAKQALLKKNHIAERQFRSRLDQYLRREVMPELMNALQNAATQAPAQ